MSDSQEPVVAIYDPGEVGREEHNRGDRWIVRLSNLFAWLFPILVVAICAQVVLRATGNNQAWLDDLQWWLYGASALIGVGYAVTTNSHVRVDIFHERFSAERKDRWEIFSLTWLFLPFILLAWDMTLGYAWSSIRADEGSDSPNGLHNLWILKSFVNLAFLFIAVAVWSSYVRHLARLTEPRPWRQLLYAFPSTMYLVNLASYYAIWLVLRATTPAEVGNREISRMPIFDEWDVGNHEIPFTILISLALTILLIAAAWAFDRRRGEV